jgi:hypothetical protein
MDIQSGQLFNVCHLSPIFADFAEAIQDGLTTLGYTCYAYPGTIVNEARNIIFGAHLVPDMSNVPPDSIIFNLEQLESGSQYCNDRYFDCLSRHTVWDYSPRNIAYLKNNNINPRAILMPLGFSPSVCRIEKPEIQDIDVLFYGALNDRRKNALIAMKEAGLNVVNLGGVYGRSLDGYIARSKIVLNIHFHASKIFEIVRVGYLLNNKKAVVAEVDTDTEIDPDIRQAVVGVSYDQLLNTTINLVRNDALREQAEQNAFKIFSGRPQSEYLKRVLTPI